MFEKLSRLMHEQSADIQMKQKLFLRISLQLYLLYFFYQQIYLRVKHELDEEFLVFSVLFNSKPRIEEIVQLLLFVPNV